MYLRTCKTEATDFSVTSYEENIFLGVEYELNWFKLTRHQEIIEVLNIKNTYSTLKVK